MYPTLFSSLLNDSFFNRPYNSIEEGPLYNILEDGDRQILELAVPGIPKDKLNIELHNGKLTVSYKAEETNKTYILQEFRDRSFERTFYLNNYTEVIETSLKDGILKIVLGMPPDKAPKKLSITES